MKVRSLGFQTDLMIVKLRGGEVTRSDGFWVVRTPDDPSFRSGNFILFDGPSIDGGLPSWASTFKRHFPGTDYLHFGIDGTHGECPPEPEQIILGLKLDRGTVLTAAALQPPPHPNHGAQLRMLRGDEDWAGVLRLQLANELKTGMEEPAEFELYCRRTLLAMRRLQEQGHGGWFGAFVDDQVVSTLGIYTDGTGIARYQNVATLPRYRDRGLAGSLVHAAGEFALHTLKTRTLVIVADPHYRAIRVYRSLGFVDIETQIELERGPLHGRRA